MNWWSQDLKCALLSSEDPIANNYLRACTPGFFPKSLFCPDWTASLRYSSGVRSSSSPVLTQNETFAHSHWVLGICQLCSPFTSYFCSYRDVIHCPYLCHAIKYVFLHYSELPRLCFMSMCQRNSEQPWMPHPTSVTGIIHQFPTEQPLLTEQIKRSRFICSPSMAQANHRS